MAIKKHFINRVKNFCRRTAHDDVAPPPQGWQHFAGWLSADCRREHPLTGRNNSHPLG